MIHEHPLRIFRYSMKNFWLLIFPLLRGIKTLSLDAQRLYTWIKGAWFDLAVVFLIIIFGYLQWRFSRIGFENDCIVHKSGIFVRLSVKIPINNICSVAEEQPLYLKPFAASYTYINTGAGEKKGVKLLLSSKNADSLMYRISGSDMRYCKIRKSNPASVLVFSFLFSSSISGAAYMAALFFKGGDVSKSYISAALNKATAETSKAIESFAVSVPETAVTIGILIVAAWFISFIVNYCRYHNFRLVTDKKVAEVSCGIFTKRRYRLNIDSINYTERRRHLLMKMFKAESISVNCPGYGDSDRMLPVLIPMKKKKDKFSINRFQRGLYFSVKPRRTSWWRYIWKNVLIIVFLPIASIVIADFFPIGTELLRFITFISEIPAFIMLAVNITALSVSGITINGKEITAKYTVGYELRTVIADIDSISEIIVSQSLFQKLVSKCDVDIRFNSRTLQKHKVIGLDADQARTLIKLINYNI